MVNQVAEFLRGNLGTVVLALITFISLLFAIIPFCKRKRAKKQIAYVHQSYEWVNIYGLGEGIELSYKKEPVKNVRITKYIIWNDGSEKITASEDIVEDKKLRIICKDENSRFLGVNILGVTNESNKFEIKQESGKLVYINFKYMGSLKHKDGVAIQVIHTGNEEDTSLECEIENGEPLYDYNERIRKRKKLGIGIAIGIGIAGAIAIAITIGSAIEIASAIGSAIASAITIVSAKVSVNDNTYKRAIPKALQQYWNANN